MAEIVSIHSPRVRDTRRPEPLWREVLGRRLRSLRERQGKTLSETAARAGISPQYLSEIERGLKEPSSEMISAVLGALGVTLVDVTEQVHVELSRHELLRFENAPPRFDQAPLPPASAQLMLSLVA